MDNENKDLQGVENENTLTPEEKVREDIRSKVADAAAEVQDEITPVDEVIEVSEESMDINIDSADEYSEVVLSEPAKVTVKKSSYIVSLIASAVVGALILLFCMQIPKWVAAMPEGKTVATVNGDEITDLDVNYYIYAQAAAYAQDNDIDYEQLAEYDWEQEVDGKKLSDTIKEKALNDAINEILMIQKGAEAGVSLSEEEIAQLDSQIAGITSTYGEEGFTLRARTMGISSPKQYAKMYRKVMSSQKVYDDISANAAAYYPEDESVLNDYRQSDGASVKHILISTEAPEGETVNVEEKKALADQILQRLQEGEDFDALFTEFNEDPGATAAGYTFGPGEMVAEFEQAAFALAIGEISGVVETEYGYHIIKRIPGLYELQAYWQDEAGKGIKIKNSRVKKLDVKAVLADIQAATDELEAQENAAAK